MRIGLILVLKGLKSAKESITCIFLLLKSTLRATVFSGSTSKSQLRKLFLVSILPMLLCGFFRSWGQGAQEGFGRNRVQYRVFKWKYISSKSCDLYFYTEQTALTNKVLQLSENEFKRISELFGFSPSSKIKVYFFASPLHLATSNTGLESNYTRTGGKTEFSKSQVEICYEGNLDALNKRIAEGIAEIFLKEMLYGGNFKEVVQNNYLLNLPSWFISGAIKYISEGSGKSSEDFVVSKLSQNKLRSPANYTEEEARLIGQSIWAFIAQRHGMSNIGNILNLTRIVRNEETAIAGTLGIPIKTFFQEWKNYYAGKGKKLRNLLNTPKSSTLLVNNRRGWKFHQIKLSDDGEKVFFVKTLRGKFKIIEYTIATRHSRTISTNGLKKYADPLIDNSIFPKIALDHAGNYVVCLPHKEVWSGYRVTTDRKKEKLNLFDDFSEVTEIDLSPNGDKLVTLGSKNDFANLYLFNLKTGKSVKITDTPNDKLNIQFSATGDSILFCEKYVFAESLDKQEKSGKADSVGSYNLTIYDIQTKKISHLLVTGSRENKANPTMAGSELLFTTELNGKKNIGITDLASADKSTQFITQYLGNISMFAFESKSTNLVYCLNTGKATNLYLEKVDPLFLSELKRRPEEGDQSMEEYPSTKQFRSLKDGVIDIRNYVFDEELQPVDSVTTKTQTPKNDRIRYKKEKKLQVTKIEGPFPYSPQVTADYLTTGILIDPIPSFGMGAKIDFLLHDSFSDHKINGGLNYYFSDIEMRNNVSYLEYQYLRHRVDFGVSFMRKSIQNSGFSSPLKQRDILNSLQFTFSYPISSSIRISASPFVQSTKRILYSLNRNNQLGGNDRLSYYTGGLMELVFDNSYSMGMNMMRGTRFKAKASYQKNIEDDSKSFGELFADFRNYFPIHNEIIFAFRATYGGFFGRSPKSYSVGGMDNWIFRNYAVSNQNDDPLKGLNSNTGIIQSEEAQSNWLFNKYVTNLRGFKYNDIYGSSFLLFNYELRVPIVKYLYHGPINSNFWRNLQLTTFIDMGTAWTGTGPFKNENSLNTKEIKEGNFTIKVRSYDDPFLTGYGLGARTLVLGYYLKFDMAWGKRNEVISDPRYYFTLGYDF